MSPWGGEALLSGEDYAKVPRLGRKTRLGAKQREAIWPPKRTQEQARLHLKSNPPWSHQWGPVQP